MSYSVNGIVETTPPGSIIAYYGSSDPNGWVICDGKPRTIGSINIYINLINMNIGTKTPTQYTPVDMRGMFLRGVGTNGVSGYTAYSGTSSIGGLQKDSIVAHSHGLSSEHIGYVYDGKNVSKGGFHRANGIYNSGEYTGSTGNETRPANVSINWIMKL